MHANLWPWKERQKVNMAKQKLHWVGRQPFPKSTRAYSRVKLIERVSPSGHKRIRSRSYKRGMLCAKVKIAHGRERKAFPRVFFFLARAYPSKPTRFNASLTTLLRFLPKQMCLNIPLFMRACQQTERLHKSQATESYLQAFWSLVLLLKTRLCHACMVYVKEHWDPGN